MNWYIFAAQMIGLVAAVLGALIATYGRSRWRRGNTLRGGTGPLFQHASDQFIREGMELHRAGSTVAWVGIAISIVSGATQIIIAVSEVRP